MITVITMYRGSDAEMFVQAVEGELTLSSRDAWRQAFRCDEYHCSEEYGCDDCNNMFFRTLDPETCHNPRSGLLLADGE